MANDRLPRVRLRPVPDRAVLVVRGDELNADLLREDARRFGERFVDWQRYAISAFLAVDDLEVDALCAARLVHFATVAVFRRLDLEAAGIAVVPTFRTPHVSLCHPDLDELVARLIACERVERVNPYYG